MNLFHENRLLHITVSQLNKQRAAVGASQVTAKPATRVVSGTQGTDGTTPKVISAGQAANDNQQANRNSNNTGSTFQSFIDPNTGFDTRFTDEQGNDTRPRDSSGRLLVNQGTPMTNAGILSNQRTLGPIGTTPLNKPNYVSPLSGTRYDARNPSGYIAPGAQVGDQRNMDGGLTPHEQQLQNNMNARKQARITDNKTAAPVMNGDAIQTVVDHLREVGQTDDQIRQIISDPKQVAGLHQQITGTTPVAPTAPAATPTSGAAKTQEQPTNPDGTPVVPLTPEQATQTAALQAANATAELDALHQDTLKDLNSTDKNNDGVTDGIATAAAESKKILQEDKIKQDAMNAENKAIAEEAARIAKEMAQMEKDKFELSQIRNESLQREANIEAELKNRRAANQLGITADTNGLKWMSEEVRKGTEALTYLVQSGDIQSSQFALQIGSQYNLDVRQALNTFNSNQAIISKGFKDELANIDAMVSADATERKKEKKELTKWYFEEKSKVDKETGDKIMKINERMQKTISEKKEEITKTQSALWDRLFKQRAQDGNMNPSLTQHILADMARAGIDVGGLDPSSMTLEQQNEVYRRSKDTQDRANAGRMPLSTQVKQLADADNSFSLLDRAEKAIKEYAGVGGPISGMTGLGDIEKDAGFVGDIVNLFRGPLTSIGTAVPGVGNVIERQREAVATFNLVKQVIGKAMEGGVLRKEDEAKYERLLPTLRDTDRLRTYKLNQLREAMEDGKRALLNSMSSAGYNTSGYGVDSSGSPYDPIEGIERGPLTNEDADDILQRLETGEPLSMGVPTGFLNSLATAHMRHEGFGTKNAPTITSANNPGALRWTPGQAKFGGKPGPKNFTVFPDFDSGYKALVADLRAKLTGGSSHINYKNNPTLLSYVKVYAPTADGNNPTGYAAALVRDLQKAGYDVDLNTPLSELSSLIG